MNKSLLALLAEAQPSLDNLAVQARGTASEASASSLAERVRAAHAPHVGRLENVLIEAAALLAGFVEDGKEIQRGEARDVLLRLRSARTELV